MYNKFFGLAEAPFNITPDSRFLFLSDRHREALSALLYGIKERKGFILLTGEIGSGKTTLSRALVNDLKNEDVRVAVILNPVLSELELLKAINDEFEIPSYYNTKKGLIDELNRFLIAENHRGANVAILIDEAQNLTPELLEQIRMLSNLETESEKLLQIVLIGQPELNETMSLPGLTQLNQRVAVRYHITPLTREEMEAYIQHRLFVARAKIEVEFTEPAFKLCFEHTGGIPRRINVVCDRALLACYAAGSYTVDDKIMAKAVQEVRGDAQPSAAGAVHGVGALAALAARLATSKAAILGAAVAACLLLILGGVALGVKLANMGAVETAPGSRPRQVANPATNPEGTAGAMMGAPPDSAAPNSGDTDTTPGAKADHPAAPTPTPDWAQLRRNKPNWMWEKSAPLVRVNSPKAAFRAAQLSILKMWGIAVDLREMAKLGEDLVVHGELKSDKLKIYQTPVPGGYFDAVRLNVPLIVKLRDPQPNESEHVVLLRSEGMAADVGDPIWGLKTYKTDDFRKRWDSAIAVFVDVKGLKDLRRGDKDDRVRGLQEFLKEKGYLADITGTYDVKTTEAVRKLQGYYKLPETGNLDDLTALILNSRMMDGGPKLNAAHDLE